MSYLDDLAQTIRHGVPARALPDSNTDSLFRIYAVLALAKGAEVQAEDVHNAWAAWMVEQEPDHPAIRPFSELDAEAQAADAPFVEAIRSAVKS